MKTIYAISVIKNEEDIVEYMVNHALSYASKVIVLDNGSEDRTYEKLKSLENNRVIVLEPNLEPYTDGLRAIIFNKFKHELKEGDWWVIQDSDEFYACNPRNFLENVSNNFHHVVSKKIDYQITWEDIKEIEFSNEFKKDIENIKFYQKYAWSEVRMIRNRKNLTWAKEDIWPSRLGVRFPTQINVKHYPQRNPKQMQKRLNTRIKNKKAGGQFFSQWDKNTWKEYLLKRENLNLDYENRDIFKTVKTKNNYKQSWKSIFINKLLFNLGMLK